LLHPHKNDANTIMNSPITILAVRFDIFLSFFSASERTAGVYHKEGLIENKITTNYWYYYQLFHSRQYTTDS